MVKKLLLYTLIVLLLVIVIMSYNYNNHITIAPPSAPTQPARLRIPALHIDTSIINVGTNTTGAMDAPVSQAVNSPYWSSVFWYDLGTTPGQTGNAVIAGHVDRVGGDPAVFWSLSSLKAGDPIFVLTRGQHTLKFVVDRVVHYPANAPAQQVLDAVFGPTTLHHLNLITCSGVWTGHGYDQRLVVFTTQVNN